LKIVEERGLKTGQMRSAEKNPKNGEKSIPTEAIFSHTGIRYEKNHSSQKLLRF
jgi:hypothetical protein